MTRIAGNANNKTKDVFWYRFPILNIGFAVKRTPMLFSERVGKKKYLPLPGGWRLVYLEKIN